MNLVPRRLLFGVLAAVVVAAILTAAAEAALVYRALGPVAAAALAVLILPVLLRGARTGSMPSWTAWVLTAVGCVIASVATVGLDPARVNVVSISWLSCGIIAGSIMTWMAGHRWPPVVTVSFMLARIVVWAGPVATLRLGVGAEVVLLVAGLMMHHGIGLVARASEVASQQERAISQWQAEQHAFRQERLVRLQTARGAAAPLLQRIIDQGGLLDAADRAECRLLEHALRDDIRGRRLVNDAVRRVVLEHRRRGAEVQLLDDGGLDGIAPNELESLLQDLAARLRPLRSSRIVVRTGQPDTPTAITVVATTPDEVAAALGEDDGDRVDLWAVLPRPVGVLA